MHATKASMAAENGAESGIQALVALVTCVPAAGLDGGDERWDGSGIWRLSTPRQRLIRAAGVGGWMRANRGPRRAAVEWGRSFSFPRWGGFLAGCIISTHGAAMYAYWTTAHRDGQVRRPQDSRPPNSGMYC